MNEKFLEIFKLLENELRDTNGQSVLDYENSLTDNHIQEKLKLCRITRNYLAHQDKKFITASQDMIDFLTDLELQIRRKSYIVSNELIKQKTVVETEYLKNILPLLVKNVVPVINKVGQVIYILDEKTYLTQLNKGNKRLELPKKLPKLNYTTKDTKIDTLSKGTYIVTSDGTINGKYVGICII